MTANVNDPAFWDGLYRSKGDGWELGAPVPPLVRAVREAGVAGEAALVLGCGRGHEARLLAEAGARRVVAVDWAPTALEEARRLTPPGPPFDRIEWRREDIFRLGETDPGAFDVAIEHTCFCAIDPARRAEWVASVAAALRPGGRLIALFYRPANPGMPPFTTDLAEVEERLRGGGFAIERAEVPEDSIELRAGREILVLARRGE